MAAPDFYGADVHRRHVEIEIGDTSGKPLRVVHLGVALHVPHIRHSVGAQEFSGQIKGRPAIWAVLLAAETNGGRFRGWLTA